MKRRSVERFARVVSIGSGAVIAAAAIFFYSKNYIRFGLTENAAAASDPSGITSTVMPPPKSTESIQSVPIIDITPEAALININTASSDELQTLSGIGEAKAAAIIAYREQHGAFSDISEIMNVSGIGEKIFESIRDRITTGVASADSEASQSSVPYPTAPINLNTASPEELQTLSGIGEAKARAIIAYREEHGAFSDISEIMNVSGIGEGIFENIREQITV